MMFVLLAGLIANDDGGARGRAAGGALTFDEAAARLAAVSDALAAADANVRGQQDLFDATRSLRLPRVTLEARWLEFEKTLELPVGTLAPSPRSSGYRAGFDFRNASPHSASCSRRSCPVHRGQIPAARIGGGGELDEAQAGRDAAAQSQTCCSCRATSPNSSRASQSVRLDVRNGLEQHFRDARNSNAKAGDEGATPASHRGARSRRARVPAA